MIKTVTHKVCDVDDFGGNIQEVIEKLKAIERDITAKNPYCTNIRIKYDYEYEWDSNEKICNICFKYDREETAEEADRRIAEEQRIEKQQAEGEFNLYLKLKEKYENVR